MSNDNLPPADLRVEKIYGFKNYYTENTVRLLLRGEVEAQRDAVAASGAGVPAGWQALFDQVALTLNCLPSSFLDGNDHVIKAAEKLAAAPTPDRAAGAGVDRTDYIAPTVYANSTAGVVIPTAFLAPDQSARDAALSEAAAMCRAQRGDTNLRYICEGAAVAIESLKSQPAPVAAPAEAVTDADIQQIATDVAGRQTNPHERPFWEFGTITLAQFARAILVKRAGSST